MPEQSFGSDLKPTPIRFPKVLPTLSPRELYQRCETHIEQHGVADNRWVVLSAVARWRYFLEQKTSEVDPYLIDRGYSHPTSLTAGHARRGKPISAAAHSALVAAVSGSKELAEALTNGDVNELRLTVPSLTDATKSQVTLLQQLARHERSLVQARRDESLRTFPFPIEPTNFFGRFLASGTEDPGQSLRHIISSRAFFTEIRAILEGFTNSKRSWLSLKISKAEKEDDVQDPVVTYSTKGSVIELISTCIDNSHDLLFSRGSSSTGFKCIELPKLPLPDDTYHKTTKHRQLAIEYLDWVLFGARDGKILTQRVSKDEIDSLKDSRERLLKAKALLSSHLENAPQDKDPRYLHSKWTTRHERLEKEVAELRDQVRSKVRSVKRSKSILVKLEEDTESHSEIRKFQSEIAAAKAARKKIIFVIPDTRRPDYFTESLDLAYTAKGSLHRSQSVRCIRNAGFLFCTIANNILDEHRAGGGNSALVQQLRQFQMYGPNLNTSARLMLERFLPTKTDPTFRPVVDKLIKAFGMPGVNAYAELQYLTEQWSGGKTATPKRLLEYCFEHATQIKERDLVDIFAMLAPLRVPLPESCGLLAVSRFSISARLIDDFIRYTEEYSPDKVGLLPKLFEDRAGFDSYRNIRLGCFGMHSEVVELEKLLAQEGAVGIIDGTDYHLELVAPEQDKAHVEKSGELWGNYVRPSERLLLALTARVINGTCCEELKNYSLSGIRRPDENDKVLAALIKAFFGIKIDLNADLQRLRKQLDALAIHDKRTILLLDGANVTDLSQYRDFLEEVRKAGFKLVVANLRDPLPGMSTLLISPFHDKDVETRILLETDPLSKLLKTEPFTPEVVSFAARQVKTHRKTSDDPLNLTLQVLASAAQTALANRHTVVNRTHVVEALPPIFHLPDKTLIRARFNAVSRFIEEVPLEVLGQSSAIREIGGLIQTHLLRIRDSSRPLTIQVPGPSGVGKTELWMKLAKAASLPFFFIECSQFTERHHLDRLVGSPTGYVGPDEGPLIKFAKAHPIAVVFLDEIEKAHPDVITGLLNFFDQGLLTAGDGKTYRRPGWIIAAASNAGADRLTGEMSKREKQDILSEAFADSSGRKRPELVRRFTVVPMLAIQEADFKQVLRGSLYKLSDLFGLVTTGIEIREIDDQAVTLLHKYSHDVCLFDASKTMGRRIAGFSETGCGAVNLSSEDTFFDMRFVTKAVEDLAGDSIRNLVITRLDEPESSPLRVALRAAPDGKKIEMVPFE